MNIIYAVMLCTGVGGTPPCYLNDVVHDYVTCRQIEDFYPDHRLRCVSRELPVWTFTSRN